MNQSYKPKHLSPEKSEVLELLDSPKVKSWRNLFLTYRSLMTIFESNLGELGCTVPRFQILLHLYIDDSLAPVELARLLDVSRANITNFLKRLQNDDLICTTAGKSSKRPDYELTVKGRKYFNELLPRHLESVEESMIALNEKTLKQLQEIRASVANKI